jgi:uncharacterized protein (TIGR02118 family)
MSPRTGIDPEDLWKYWQEVHGINVSKWPGLKRYVINRRITEESRQTNASPFWGLVEMWWGSMEGYDEARISPAGARTAADGFSTRVTGLAAWVEENVIKTYSEVDKPIKVISIFSMREMADQDEFWKYLIQIYGPAIVKASGTGLKGYTINRLVQPVGGEVSFWGIEEFWWKDAESRNQAKKALAEFNAAQGKYILNDFQSRIVNHAGKSDATLIKV